MIEQIKDFNKAYEKVKKLGFENYFCIGGTTWKEADTNFKNKLELKDEEAIMILQENVNIVLRSDKKLPYCKKCKHLFSPQEFKAGFKECEHCDKLGDKKCQKHQ